VDYEPQKLKRTPLHTEHLALHAKLVPFAGWDMPVQYSGIVEETLAVRRAAGLFDIGHMGRLHIHGPEAESLLNRLTPNRIRDLRPGQAHYSLLLQDDGGILDDIIVYRLGEEEFSLVLNASNHDADVDWIRRHASAGIEIRDYSAATAMVAIQGPLAAEKLQTVCDADLAIVPRFGFTSGKVAGVASAICRTGYTGEDGFELVCPAEPAATVWRELLACGAAPCGLGARDALRIEAGYPLYGHELDASTTPVDAGLMWVVDLEKGDFVGREAVRRAAAAPPARRLAAFRMTERAVPRHGYTVYHEGEEAGTVTSGVFSPTAQAGLGLAYLRPPAHLRRSRIEIGIRDRRFPAVVVSRKDLLQPLP
jgi:aminomethyltransferase